MVTQGVVKTRNGAKIYLYRGTTENGSLSSTQYLPETKFKVGINNLTVSTTDTELVAPVPISTGVVNDDGSNTLTGSDGGDNSTDNTTTFKPGAQTTDNTAQNLIKNDTNASAVWTINIATAGTAITDSKYVGLWIYMTASAITKLVAAGTAISVKFRTNGDGATLYYEMVYEDGDFSAGWNWLYSWPDTVADLDTGAGGAPSGVINELVITITTINATDEFAAGDVVYDLLRTYEYSDTTKTYVTNYPAVDYNNLEVTKKSYLTTIEAVGFNLNGYVGVNQDTSPLTGTSATYTDRGKSDTDEFIFTIKERIIL